VGTIPDLLGLTVTIGLTQTTKNSSFNAGQKLNIVIHSIASLKLLPGQFQHI